MEKVEKDDKKGKILNLDPECMLRFKGPFDDVVSSKLELSNPSDREVSFKVKTTAPKRYCVRPNSGVVPPKGEVTVVLMLQPFVFDPQEKNKHKFLVLALFTPSGDMTIDDQFKSANPDEVMETKLKCVFEMPADAVESTQLPRVQMARDSDTAVSSSPPAAVGGSPSSKDSSKEVSQLIQQITQLNEDIKKMKSEHSQLRQENMILKEEKLVAQRAAGSTQGSIKMPPPTQETGLMSQVHMMLAVICVLIGYLIAKLIL